MNQGFLAVVILLVLAAVTGIAIIGISALIGRRASPEERAIPYECGLDPACRPAGRFPVKFFLVAVLFLVFDVEIVFLIPWAAAFRGALSSGAGQVLAVELALFVGFLALAFAFAWARGALEWEK
ncbi:MAG: NADH-quinone oxidoreductase subunit A [bacterium]